jgi:hypothetical protein
MFFANNLSISVVSINGNALTLAKDVDYWFVGKLLDVGESSGGVYSAIFIADPALAILTTQLLRQSCLKIMIIKTGHLPCLYALNVK